VCGCLGMAGADHYGEVLAAMGRANQTMMTKNRQRGCLPQPECSPADQVPLITPAQRQRITGRFGSAVHSDIDPSYSRVPGRCRISDMTNQSVDPRWPELQ
jgi:hypothetical protein